VHVQLAVLNVSLEKVAAEMVWNCVAGPVLLGGLELTRFFTETMPLLISSGPSSSRLLDRVVALLCWHKIGICQQYVAKQKRHTESTTRECMGIKKSKLSSRRTKGEATYLERRQAGTQYWSDHSRVDVLR
jgi:hypothetical protein